MTLLHKLSLATYYRTTYRAGLLQAKAYRALKHETSHVLKKSRLSTVEWAFLGLLADKQPLRAHEAAYELGVKPPFITLLVTSLEKRGLIMITKLPSDNRVRTLSLTPLGSEFVAKTEARVRAETKHLVAGVSPGDIMGYLAVLERIVQNTTRT